MRRWTAAHLPVHLWFFLVKLETNQTRAEERPSLYKVLQTSVHESDPSSDAGRFAAVSVTFRPCWRRQTFNFDVVRNLSQTYSQRKMNALCAALQKKYEFNI